MTKSVVERNLLVGPFQTQFLFYLNDAIFDDQPREVSTTETNPAPFTTPTNYLGVSFLSLSPSGSTARGWKFTYKINPEVTTTTATTVMDSDDTTFILAALLAFGTFILAVASGVVFGG